MLTSSEIAGWGTGLSIGLGITAAAQEGSRRAHLRHLQEAEKYVADAKKIAHAATTDLQKTRQATPQLVELIESKQPHIETFRHHQAALVEEIDLHEQDLQRLGERVKPDGGWRTEPVPVRNRLGQVKYQTAERVQQELGHLRQHAAALDPETNNMRWLKKKTANLLEAPAGLSNSDNFGNKARLVLTQTKNAIGNHVAAMESSLGNIHQINQQLHRFSHGQKQAVYKLQTELSHANANIERYTAAAKNYALQKLHSTRNRNIAAALAVISGMTALWNMRRS